MFTPQSVLRICLHENHVYRDKLKRLRTVSVFTLTSSTISKRMMIQSLFLQWSSIINVFYLCKQIITRMPGPLQIQSSKLKRREVGG